MPRLPSGKHIGISSERLLRWAAGADFNNAMEFTMHIRTIDKMGHFIDVVYYRGAEDRPPNGAEPEDAYLPGLKVSDVATSRCGWCEEDKDWFAEWLTTPLFIAWFDALQTELHEVLSARPLPDVVEGFFDDDLN